MLRILFLVIFLDFQITLKLSLFITFHTGDYLQLFAWGSYSNGLAEFQGNTPVYALIIDKSFPATQIMQYEFTFQTRYRKMFWANTGRITGYRNIDCLTLHATAHRQRFAGNRIGNVVIEQVGRGKIFRISPGPGLARWVILLHSISGASWW